MALMNYQHAPDNCTPGERVVFNTLKRNLPDDYFVWFEPTLFGKKMSRYPDFVVLGSAIGLIVVEVKDWSIKGIRSANKDTFEIYEGETISVRTNPEKQAREHMLALRNHIESYEKTDPDVYRSLLKTRGAHKGRLAFSTSALVAFPNIACEQWQSSGLGRVVNEKQVLLKDDLADDLAGRFLQAAVFKAALSQEQLETLKWIMYPQIRVPGTQLKLLDPEQINISHLDIYLPPEAQRIAREPLAKLVRGAVGSGKTLILLNRAKFMSEVNPNWRVLVLTYNKSLVGYMRQIFEQIGGDPTRVKIANFHRWCYDLLSPLDLFSNPQDESSCKGLIKSILDKMGVNTFTPEFLYQEFDWIKQRLHYQSWNEYLDPDKVKRVGRGRGLGGDERQKRQAVYDLFVQYQRHLKKNNLCDWADIPNRVLRAMEQGEIKPHQYHAVLIDEAQDFAPSWFRVAFEMVKPETNMVFIVGDGAQRIYRRDFTWKELGLGITRHNSFVLNRSYRSTREIVDVALDVIRDSPTIAADLHDAGDGIINPDDQYAHFRHGLVPVLLSFDSPHQEYQSIAAEIANLLEQGYQLQDIAVFQRHHNNVKQIAQALGKDHIPYQVMKDNLNLKTPKVKICTLHSAKGLEFKVVFVCGLEQFKVNEPVDTDDAEFQGLLDQERKLLYVGMTRARERLYITYSGVGAEWITDRLKAKLSGMWH